MAWPQNLIDLFVRPDCTEALASFAGNEGRARRVAVLLNNPAVGGNQEIAELIADSCEVLCFTRGQYLIEQDDIGDDVFYLLAGEADIVLNGEKITYRQAPTQVGEMAARSPGKARSASVSARSKVLVVAKISGDLACKVFRGGEAWSWCSAMWDEPDCRPPPTIHHPSPSCHEKALSSR